jgi:hypothetical protein
LCQANVQGEIYQWDIGMRRCVRKFTDEGAITNTALHISPVAIDGSSYLAIGYKISVSSLSIQEIAIETFFQSDAVRTVEL